MPRRVSDPVKTVLPRRQQHQERCGGFSLPLPILRDDDDAREAEPEEEKYEYAQMLEYRLWVFTQRMGPLFKDCRCDFDEDSEDSEIRFDQSFERSVRGGPSPTDDSYSQKRLTRQQFLQQRDNNSSQLIFGLEV